MGSTTKKGNTANPGLAQAADVPPPSFVVVTGPFELTIHGSATGSLYIGWTPTKCSLKVTDNPRADRNIVLKNRDTTSGGQVVFRSTYAAAEADTLALTVPGDGTAVEFYLAGKFGRPSFHDQDGAISINDAVGDAALHQRTVMVRIRKDANTLTNAERDRFLNAFASLNANTALYQVFVDSHTNAADPEIHQRPSFLVWHRAFVLALERELQAIDPSVTVPFWRFDRTAPNVLIANFMGGEPNGAGRVDLSATNPLRNWTISGVVGIVRVPSFDRLTGAPTLIDETTTLGLGSSFAPFRLMEDNPHGSAHVSFTSGNIRSIGDASKDPLFFMLHCNVDRLWARWQLVNNRWNVPDNNTYDDEGSGRDGDRLADTLWPWNGVAGGSRPPTAPGGTMPQLPFPSKPSPQVTVQETIDYIGRTEGNTNNFDYDDVPFV
jgi:tyrosinase